MNLEDLRFYMAYFSSGTAVFYLLIYINISKTVRAY